MSSRQEIIDGAIDRITEVVFWAAAEVDRIADEAEAATGVRVHPRSPIHPLYWRDEPTLRVVRDSPGRNDQQPVIHTVGS